MNPMEMMMQMMTQQNPQMQQLMKTFFGGGMNPNQAKQQVMEMITNGKIDKQQMDQFYSFAEQAGIPKDSFKELEGLNIKDKTSSKTNRW